MNEDFEPKTWKISKANDKNRGKRLKRQFKVFIISVTIIIILVLIGICIYNKYECEMWNVPKVQEDEIFYDEMENIIYEDESDVELFDEDEIIWDNEVIDENDEMSSTELN